MVRMHNGTEYVEFDTPYGPAYVVYSKPKTWSDQGAHLVQVVVRCPGNIVWDRTVGKWWPEPQVIDYVLPRARAICQMMGVPPYEWLRELRRDDIWAIEKEFERGIPISLMMHFSDEDDYDGRYSRW